MELSRRFIIEESGQGLVEYGFIIALVVLVAVVGVIAFGVSVEELYDNIHTQVNGVLNP